MFVWFRAATVFTTASLARCWDKDCFAIVVVLLTGDTFVLHVIEVAGVDVAGVDVAGVGAVVSSLLLWLCETRIQNEKSAIC